MGVDDNRMMTEVGMEDNLTKEQRNNVKAAFDEGHHGQQMKIRGTTGPKQ